MPPLEAGQGGTGRRTQVHMSAISETPEQQAQTNFWEGFWGIQIIHVGQTLELFEAFANWETPDKVCQERSIESRHLIHWCSAAQSLGLLEKSQEQFRTAPALKDWLTNSEGFTSSHLHLARRMNETFEAILHGRALPEPPIALRILLQDSLRRNYRWLFEAVPLLHAEFRAHLESSSRALEVGCGIGLGLAELQQRYPQIEVYGLERDYECAREAERLNRCVIHVGELPAKTFEKSFDLIICFRTLAGTTCPRTLLAQCRQVLNPGGWLVLGTELAIEDRNEKTAGQIHAEHFLYQLLAGEASFRLYSRQEILTLLTELEFETLTEIPGTDWGTPVFLARASPETGGQ